VEKNNNSPLDIRFVAKTSDIRNFSQNIRSDAKTSEVATLHTTSLSQPNRRPERNDTKPQKQSKVTNPKKKRRVLIL